MLSSKAIKNGQKKGGEVEQYVNVIFIDNLGKQTKIFHKVLSEICYTELYF